MTRHPGCFRLSRLNAGGLCLVEVAEHVALGHLSLAAAGRNHGRVQLVFGHQLACGRAGLLARAGCVLRDRLLDAVVDGQRRSGGAIVTDQADNLVSGHDITITEEDLLQYAVLRGGHFQHHLVGFNIDQRLVTPYHITGLLVPAGNYTVTDGFG